MKKRGALNIFSASGGNFGNLRDFLEGVNLRLITANTQFRKLEVTTSNGDGRAGGRIFQWGTILDLRGNEKGLSKAET